MHKKMIKEQIKKVLIIVAHQDDETIGCGGTIKKWSINKDIRVVCVSDGCTGIDHTRDYEYNLVKTREKELENASTLLGFSPECWGYKCQQIENNTKLFHSLIETIRKYCPNLIITHSSHDKHRDHRTIHDAVVEATWKAHEDIHPELGKSWKVNDVWGMEILDPLPSVDYVIDISTTIGSKLYTLELYQSQSNILSGLNNYIEGLGKVRGYSIGVKYGEAFKRISKEPVEI